MPSEMALPPNGVLHNATTSSSVTPDLNPAKKLSLGIKGGSSGPSEALNSMRAFNPMRFLPRVSTLSFALVASVAVGAGLLIRDGLGSQAWLHQIKDGFVHAGMEIKTFFTETAPALSSTPAIAAYIGVGAFLATTWNLACFAKGVRIPNPTFGDQAWRGVKTVISGAAAGTGWAAMAGTLGAGAMVPAVIIGASAGAGIGLVQALLMCIRSVRPAPAQ